MPSLATRHVPLCRKFVGLSSRVAFGTFGHTKNIGTDFVLFFGVCIHHLRIVASFFLIHHNTSYYITAHHVNALHSGREVVLMAEGSK